MACIPNKIPVRWCLISVAAFDVTVLEYATPVIEVHASAGDNFLGGEDFTHMLVDEVLNARMSP